MAMRTRRKRTRPAACWPSEGSTGGLSDDCHQDACKVRARHRVYRHWRIRSRVCPFCRRRLLSGRRRGRRHRGATGRDRAAGGAVDRRAAAACRGRVPLRDLHLQSEHDASGAIRPVARAAGRSNPRTPDPAGLDTARRTRPAPGADDMTTETDLLPLPEGYDKYDPPLLYEGQMFNERQMQGYARANVAHATATLQAEVEALRAEVERLREALDDIRSRSVTDLVMRSDRFELVALLGDIYQIA